jgi:hypothetical protein
MNGEFTMSLSEDVIAGTLKPDGTLELDQRPSLAPGRVEVVLRKQAESVPPPKENWFQFMQDARKKMEEAGCHFMDEKEVESHIGRLREGDWIDQLLRQPDARDAQEQP